MQEDLAVVDDERDFIHIVSEVAMCLGYRVSFFTSAKAFLNSIDEDPPQLILLDMVMPDIDGIEVIKTLSKRTEHFEIILCTGFNPQYLEVAEVITKLGTDRVRGKLLKPIRLHDIENLLQKPSA